MLYRNLFYFILPKTFFTYSIKENPVSDDLFQYLFIQKMTPNYFLQNYGSNFQEKMPVSSEIAKVKSSTVNGSVFRNHGEYYCRINLSEGFFCSCNPAKKYRFEIKNDNKFYKKLCPHLTFLIQDIFLKENENDIKKSNAKKVVNSLIPLIRAYIKVISKIRWG